jgi:hypothetical protein
MEDLSWQQIYAIYIAYMNAMKGQFLNYTSMDLSDVDISVDSFNLMCRGTILDADGNVIAGNTTIFTPFTMLNDWTIRTGLNNLTQSGYVIVWGHGPDLLTYIDMMAHPELYLDNMGSMDKSMDYIMFSAGYQLNITEMTYNGVPVTSHELAINSLDFYIHSATDNPHGNPWSLTDMAWLIEHWYWFAMALGAVLAIAGGWTRNYRLLGVGALIIVIGLGFWLYHDWQDNGGLLSDGYDASRSVLKPLP